MQRKYKLSYEQRGDKHIELNGSPATEWTPQKLVFFADGDADAERTAQEYINGLRGEKKDERHFISLDLYVERSNEIKIVRQYEENVQAA